MEVYITASARRAHRSEVQRRYSRRHNGNGKPCDAAHYDQRGGDSQHDLMHRRTRICRPCKRRLTPPDGGKARRVSIRDILWAVTVLGRKR